MVGEEEQTEAPVRPTELLTWVSEKAHAEMEGQILAAAVNSQSSNCHLSLFLFMCKTKKNPEAEKHTKHTRKVVVF